VENKAGRAKPVLTESASIEMRFVQLARNAMGTRFELVLPARETPALRAAAEAALAEIDRIEAELSVYCPTSQVAHLNRLAAQQSVKVTHELFCLLQRARDIWLNTQGAFDITVGPVLHCWGITNGAGRVPTQHELTAARALVGMDKIELSETDRTVRFKCAGVQINLGAIGKGFAVDAAIAMLRDAGVRNALVHAGTSTVFALGKSPDANPWKVAILAPPENFGAAAPAACSLTAGERHDTRPAICVVELADAALSVSAVWGRWLQTQNGAYGHIVDPRTAMPVRDTLLGAVVRPNATEADALSTALVVLGVHGLDTLAYAYPGTRMLAITSSARDKKFSVHTLGLNCK